MTPQEINTAARRRYNAVGDTNWSEAELYELIYEAELELAREALLVEKSYEATTVSGTQEYSFPTNAIAIRRITYDGNRLEEITFREDDMATAFDSATTDTGTPQYYFQWRESIFLRPTPDSALTLKIWSYDEPSQVVGAAQALEVPSQWHMGIVNFLISEMFAKDLNHSMSQYYFTRWEKVINKAIAYTARKKHASGNQRVRDEETMASTLIGLA